MAVQVTIGFVHTSFRDYGWTTQYGNYIQVRKDGTTQRGERRYSIPHRPHQESIKQFRWTDSLKFERHLEAGRLQQIKEGGQFVESQRSI